MQLGNRFIARSVRQSKSYSPTPKEQEPSYDSDSKDPPLSHK